MRCVMVFGTFDILHEGHRFLFREAQKHGDALVVVVARDATVEKLKGALPQQPEAQRLAAVSKDPSVARALLGNLDDYYAIIEQEKPSVICLGYDQHLVRLDEQILAQRGITATIIRMPAYQPEKYKSSRYKRRPGAPG